MQIYYNNDSVKAEESDDMIKFERNRELEVLKNGDSLHFKPSWIKQLNQRQIIQSIQNEATMAKQAQNDTPSRKAAQINPKKVSAVRGPILSKVSKYVLANQKVTKPSDNEENPKEVKTPIKKTAKYKELAPPIETPKPTQSINKYKAQIGAQPKKDPTPPKQVDKPVTPKPQKKTAEPETSKDSISSFWSDAQPTNHAAKIHK